MKRRTMLKAVGAGVGAICLLGAANFYRHSLTSNRRKPLLIGGSTIVKRFLDIQLIDAFSKHHPEADLLIEGGYSQGGLIALERGSIDLAMISNDLSPEGQVDFLEYLIGIETIGIIVNENSLIKNISKDNARKIFRREIVNWKELGGPDSVINLYSRQDNAATKRTVEQVLLDNELVHESAKVLPSSQAMAEHVSLDPFAIGFISQQGYLRAKDPTIKIRPLSIDGVAMDERSINLAIYPLVRQLFLVLRADSSEMAKKFVAFVISDQGQTLMADSGALRVS